MAYDEKNGSCCGEYGYPVKPYYPGKPMLQAMGEAMCQEEEHSKWHDEHPGEMCDPAMFPMNNYDTIEDGLNLLSGTTFEPGDSFVPNKGK